MVAVVFPGQGSQKPRMGEDLYRNNTYARQVFDQISSATGIDVALLCFDSDEATLRQTQNAQLALYTCSVAAFYALSESVDRPFDGAAGHSVGEYAALAASGIITITEGARLVRKRGELMAKCQAGTMAAVIGLDADEVEAALASVEGTCVIANDNCPGQIVISGEIDAVQAASARCAERGAKRVLPLTVSGAFHSPLMEGAAESLGEAIDAVTMGEGSMPVYSNVTAEPATDWAPLLKQQLKSRVRWTETIRNMRRDGFTTYIECGSGEVLNGLIKRIDKEARGMVAVDSATLEETVKTL